MTGRKGFYVNEELLKKLNFVVFGENQWRLTTAFDGNGVLSVFYDAHGQSVAEAQKTIRNIVNLVRIPFKLTIIHGFNHGTAIKRMLDNETFNGKVSIKYRPHNNSGVTVLRIIA